MYIADIEAKKLMQENPKIRTAIRGVFGKESYENNKLNRVFLASKVFGDAEALEKLNAIVHPAVHKHFLNFKAKQTSPYLVYENAISL